jgi:hypothetical protein
MLPSTMFRVPLQTAGSVNDRIREQTEQSLDRYLYSTRIEIDDRLRELSREWDMERTLETNAAMFSLAGLGLGTRFSRAWLLLPVVVASFLLQHALHGWCPPVPLFRRFGIRTAAEIDAERCALKLLRGDFREISRRLPRADDLLRAALT